MGVRCLQMAPTKLLGATCAAAAHAPLAAPPSLLSSRDADANSRLEGSQSRGQEQCCSWTIITWPGGAQRVAVYINWAPQPQAGARCAGGRQL